MKKINLHLLLLINQLIIKNENTLFLDKSITLSLFQINYEMSKYLKLSKKKIIKTEKINARYVSRVEDILAYESGHEKNARLMTAWDNWVKSLEEILTKTQYNKFCP